jgi:hypothetical protein
MPLKLRSSKGKVKRRTFGQAAGDLKKKGYSATSARKIIGHIQKKQEGKSKRKKKR